MLREAKGWVNILVFIIIKQTFTGALKERQDSEFM